MNLNKSTSLESLKSRGITSTPRPLSTLTSSLHSGHTRGREQYSLQRFQTLMLWASIFTTYNVSMQLSLYFYIYNFFLIYLFIYSLVNIYINYIQSKLSLCNYKFVHWSRHNNECFHSCINWQLLVNYQYKKKKWENLKILEVVIVTGLKTY